MTNLKISIIETSRRERRRRRVDVLTNSIGEDVQSMLRPLNFLQLLILCPKYSIRNNLIAPNKFTSKILSVCGTLLFIAAYFYRSHYSYYDDSFAQYSGTMRIFMSLFETIVLSVGFVINTIVVVTQTNNNVEFVLTIQDIHCTLISKDNFKRYTRGNWISMISIVAFYFCFLACACFMYEQKGFSVSICVIILISFDINLVYAIRSIQLLKDKVDLWNEAVLSARSTRDELKYNTLFVTFVKLLKCYETYKECFQLLILYHIGESLIHALLYVQIFIDFLKFSDNITYYNDNIGKGMITLAWLLKNLTLQIALPVKCESFYEAINKVQDICEIAINTNISDEAKNLYKNVQRLHKSSFTKMSACGLFDVDALLTIRLVGLLTQHIIVLLQFALL